MTEPNGRKSCPKMYSEIRSSILSRVYLTILSWEVNDDKTEHEGVRDAVTGSENDDPNTQSDQSSYDDAQVTREQEGTT